METPQTAVDTGRSTTQMISVDKIKTSPFQAREAFDEAALADLAQSIKEEGLLNPITVRMLPDGMAELIAGERRLRAVKLLGWSEIETKVLSNVADDDAAIKGLIENLQRADLNPIEAAGGYRRLANPPFNLTQEAIAKKVGIKDRSVIARSLALLEEPDEIKDFVARATFSIYHLRFLDQIEDKEQRIHMAKQVAEEGWSAKETERRVKQLISGAPDKALKSSAEPAAHSSERIPDPLADLWNKAISSNEYLVAHNSQWGISYDQREVAKIGGDKSISLPAWNFWFINATETPRSELKKWLLALADAMGDTTEEVASSQKVMEAVAPKTEEDVENFKKPQPEARIPQTAEEWKDVEALATKGPGAVYAWAFGADSYFAQKMGPLSWTDVGMSDPITGCHQVMEALQKFQS